MCISPSLQTCSLNLSAQFSHLYLIHLHFSASYLLLLLAFYFFLQIFVLCMEQHESWLCPRHDLSATVSGINCPDLSISLLKWWRERIKMDNLIFFKPAQVISFSSAYCLLALKPTECLGPVSFGQIHMVKLLQQRCSIRSVDRSGTVIKIHCAAPGFS